jgi:hypothetical protein
MPIKQGGIMKLKRKVNCMWPKNFFTKTASFFIVFELVFAPVAIAKSGPVVNTVINEAMGLGNALMQQQQQQQQNAMIQAQMQQFEAMVRPASFQDQFFPQCSVLQAKTNVVGAEYSCEGTPDPSKKLMYQKISSLSEEIANDYDNFMVKPHKDNMYGVSCYQKAGKSLDNALKAEIQKIDEQINQMKAQHEAFLLTTNPIVEDIKLKDAVMNGGPNASKYLKDAKFNKLLSDPACTSIYEGQNFQEMGKAGGLNGIKNEVVKKGQGADSGSGVMSATSIIQTQGQIEKEIRKMAKEVASNTQNKDISSTSKEELLPISAAYNLNQSPVLTKAIDEQLKYQQNEYKVLMREHSKLPGVNKEQQELLKMSFAEDFNVEEQTQLYTSTFYEKCVQNNIESTFSSLDKFMGKIYDPTISDKANEEGDNLFASELKNILDRPFDKKTTLLSKLNEIKALETSGANSSKTIVLGKSTALNNTKFTASQRYRPSDFVKVWFTQCQDSFSATSKHSRVPPAKVIELMKSTNSKIKQLATTFPGKVETAILNNMLNCTNNPSLGSASLSCSDSSVLSPQSAGFCLSGAVKCAANMKSCEAKINNQLETIRTEQLAKAKLHKEKVDYYKKITQGYAVQYKKLTESFMKAQAMYFNAEPFKAGEFNIKLAKDQSTALQGVDESLNLEDPNVYFEIALQNMQTLKTQLDDHAKKIAKEVNDRSNVQKENYTKMVKDWNDLKKKCKGFYDTLVAQEQQNFATAEQKRSEDQAKINNFCVKAEAYNQAPGCGEGIEDLADESAEVVSFLNYDAAAIGQINKYKTMCANFSNEETNPYLDNGSDANKYTLEDLCSSSNTKKPVEDCDEYFDLKKKYGSSGTCNQTQEVDIKNWCFDKNFPTSQIPIIKNSDSSNCIAGSEPTKDQVIESAKYKESIKGEGCMELQAGRDAYNDIKEDLQSQLTYYNQAQAVKDMGQVEFNLCNSQNWQQFGKNDGTSQPGGVQFSSGTYGQQD